MTTNELPYRPTLAERIPGPFLIFRAFLLAFSPSILALSAAATLICCGLGLWSPAVHYTGALPMSTVTAQSTLLDALQPINEVTSSKDLWNACVLHFTPYFHADGAAFYWQIAGSFLLWSFVSLAIARIAAVKLTVGDGTSIKRAVGWALEKYPSWLGALIIAAAAGYFFWGVAWVGMRIPYLNQWLFPVWYVCLGLGVVVGLGVYIGIHFLAPALVTENCDCFDAVSRSFAYATQKPIHLIGYILFTLIVGNFGIILLTILLSCFNQMTYYWIIAAGMEVTTYIEYVMHFVWLTQMYVLNAFWFTSATAIYLLLRFRVDKVELDEVWLPTPYGLPRHKLS